MALDPTIALQYNPPQINFMQNAQAGLGMAQTAQNIQNLRASQAIQQAELPGIQAQSVSAQQQAQQDIRMQQARVLLGSTDQNQFMETDPANSNNQIVNHAKLYGFLQSHGFADMSQAVAKDWDAASQQSILTAGNSAAYTQTQKTYGNQAATITAQKLYQMKLDGVPYAQRASYYNTARTALSQRPGGALAATSDIMPANPPDVDQWADNTQTSSMTPLEKQNFDKSMQEFQVQKVQAQQTIAGNRSNAFAMQAQVGADQADTNQEADAQKALQSLGMDSSQLANMSEARVAQLASTDKRWQTIQNGFRIYLKNNPPQLDAQGKPMTPPINSWLPGADQVLGAEVQKRTQYNQARTQAANEVLNAPQITPTGPVAATPGTGAVPTPQVGTAGLSAAPEPRTKGNKVFKLPNGRMGEGTEAEVKAIPGAVILN